MAIYINANLFTNNDAIVVISRQWNLLISKFASQHTTAKEKSAYNSFAQNTFFKVLFLCFAHQ